MARDLGPVESTKYMTFYWCGADIFLKGDPILRGSRSP